MALYETYNMKLKIVTPVIINNGEYFEYCELYPTDKLVSEANQVPYYKGRQINTANLFAGLSDSEIKMFIDASSDAIYQRNNAELSILRNRVLSKSTKEKTRIPCRFLTDAYNELKDKPYQQVSKVIQEELYGFTYIPGSSVKGAIRTALLEYLRKSSEAYSEVDGKITYKQIETKLLNSSQVQDDPFKYLKISDFTFEGIEGIQYIGKINNGTTTPIYSAMTSAYALTKTEIVAKGTIEVDPMFYKKVAGKDFNDLLDKISNFYVDNINKKTSEFRTKPMKDAYKYLGDNWVGASTPICLGHYIGIQNYTYNTIRTTARGPLSPDINIKGGKSKTIEDGIFPGICILAKENC